MRTAIILSIVALQSSAWATEALDFANGRSPDGSFSVRVRPPTDAGAIPSLEVISVTTNTVIGTTHTGGYAHYPSVAEDASTAVLWSPDSKHLALMTRGTKRSTELRLYRVEASGLTEITLPSPTDRAFQLLKATVSYRCTFQRPKMWIDNETLTVRASGDIKNPSGSGVPIWYEVDITFNIHDKKITDAKVITTKPKEG